VKDILYRGPKLGKTGGGAGCKGHEPRKGKTPEKICISYGEGTPRKVRPKEALYWKGPAEFSSIKRAQ